MREELEKETPEKGWMQTYFYDVTHFRISIFKVFLCCTFKIRDFTVDNRIFKLNYGVALHIKGFRLKD